MRTTQAFLTKSITSLAASTAALSGIGNLAYACILCNRYKGTDIASIDHSGRPIRLFDPRRDSWGEHFKLDGPIIQPLTPVGEVTARMLRLNAAERVIERRLFQALGSYRKV
jgi:hypothetical protein